MTFDLEKYLDDGFEAQNALAIASGEPPLHLLTNDDRYRKVIEMIGHLVEEAGGEVRAHVKRRPWKQNETGFLDSLKKREEFLDEMVDVLLFFRAILVFGNIPADEFIFALNKKLNYNKVREDHKR